MYFIVKHLFCWTLHTLTLSMEVAFIITLAQSSIIVTCYYNIAQNMFLKKSYKYLSRYNLYEILDSLLHSRMSNSWGSLRCTLNFDTHVLREMLGKKRAFFMKLFVSKDNCIFLRVSTKVLLNQSILISQNLIVS